jgi:hypothetical protein
MTMPAGVVRWPGAMGPAAGSDAVAEDDDLVPVSAEHKEQLLSTRIEFARMLRVDSAP